MTTVELMKNVGCTAKWGDGTGLEYLVTITDSRLRWGAVDYLVTPVAGSGQRWVAGTSVVLQTEG